MLINELTEIVPRDSHQWCFRTDENRPVWIMQWAYIDIFVLYVGQPNDTLQHIILRSDKSSLSIKFSTENNNWDIFKSKIHEVWPHVENVIKDLDIKDLLKS